MKHIWNLNKSIQKNQNISCLILILGILHIKMQFRIVGYLPLVGTMFRYAESHLFSYHSMFRPGY